ncbi:MAG: hypothetical protein H0T53_01340 [Herpetosiphonaceae bacterium]|nr:hypothetical protein [Herpetosiphonaceae bacterium]
MAIVRKHLRSLSAWRKQHSWFLLIAAGYLLRLVLMPTTGHHDTLFMPWHAHFISQGHWNVYEYIHQTYGDGVLRVPVWAPYPYGFYAFTAFWAKVFNSVGLLDMANWPWPWIVAQPARLAFLFKLLSLPFDLVIGMILAQVGGKQRGLLMWALWTWSATVLYMVMMGQNDFYPTAFMVAGLYLAYQAVQRQQARQPWRRRAAAAMLVLGLGATFKTFPLFLIIPLGLLITPRWGQRLGLIGIGVMPFIVAAIPFLDTPAFIQGVLLNPEGVQVFQQVDLFGQRVSLFFGGYCLLLLYLAVRSQPCRPQHVWDVGTLVVGMLFAFVFTPYYWLIWLTPLVIVQISRYQQRFIWLWLTIEGCFAVIFLVKERDFAVGLPRLLAGEFFVANPADALALNHPTLKLVIDRLLTVAASATVAGIFILLGMAAYSLARSPAPMQRWRAPKLVVLAPAGLLASVLLFGLWNARSMLIERSPHPLNRTIILSDAQPTISQPYSAEHPLLTGVELALDMTANEARMKLCLEQSGATPGVIACRWAHPPLRDFERNNAYFIFDPPVQLAVGQAYSLTFAIQPGAQPIAVRASAQPGLMYLGANSHVQQGSLALGMLRHFNLSRASRRLIGQNILADPALLLLLAVAALLVVYSLLTHYRRLQRLPQPAIADETSSSREEIRAA